MKDCRNEIGNLREQWRGLRKEALTPAAAFLGAMGLGGRITTAALQAAVATAVLTGGAAGLLAATAASPGEQAASNLQRSFLRDRLRGEVERRRRELQLQELRQAEPEAPQPRAMHL